MTLPPPDAVANFDQQLASMIEGHGQRFARYWDALQALVDARPGGAAWKAAIAEDRGRVARGASTDRAGSAWTCRTCCSIRWDRDTAD